MSAAVVAVLALVVLIFLQGGMNPYDMRRLFRLRLRTLLIAMTLIAVVLSIILWVSRVG